MTLKRNTIVERQRRLLKDRVRVSLMSQRRSALIMSADHKKESLCIHIVNKICLFVFNLGDIVVVGLVLLVQKTVLVFCFLHLEAPRLYSTRLRYILFFRTSHFDAEVE